MSSPKTPVHSFLVDRRSIRAFDPRPIEDETLYLLFEAARWAPSAFNEQPWRFVMAGRENETEFQQMLELLSPSNRSWAKNGSVLILTLAKMFTSHDNRVNRHALYDVGLAVGNLSVQATSMGLSLHQMGGFDSAKSREFYSIPEGYEPISIILVGYPGNAELLPEHLRLRESNPRVRKAIDEFVFSSKFGSGHSLQQH
ncbi:MAG: nitroreductase family protein [Bacteroidetes bacterium]|nr:nitroreductase family protein [Bacteroidota bacterium]MBL0256482.1 nitroreductase family protein [Bacteroidota bacterium]